MYLTKLQVEATGKVGKVGKVGMVAIRVILSYGDDRTGHSLKIDPTWQILLPNEPSDGSLRPRLNARSSSWPGLRPH